MDTAPTGAQLGIVISATKDIAKGESIVLDYDEHNRTYFYSCMSYIAI